MMEGVCGPGTKCRAATPFVPVLLDVAEKPHDYWCVRLPIHATHQYS